MEQALFAILLSLIAGLSTTIGSVIAIVLKKQNPRFISFIMGFSAGVMILVSFVELLQESIEFNGILFGILFFILGMLIMFIIDIKVSHHYQFEDKNYEQLACQDKNSPTLKSLNSSDISTQGGDHSSNNHFDRFRARRRQKRQLLQRTILKNNGSPKLYKASLLVAVGVFIHNFPEGMATFVGTIKEVELGVLLAFAIALHNIPEGIAVSVPVYACTGSKKRAFMWSFLSGISEPIGAILTWLILAPIINEYLLNAMLAIVGGLMVYISLDELLPISRSLAKEHYSILGIISGIFVMALSLAIL
ncbi:MAG: zinc transporter ZupT [Promethearchaeota archaeon]|nr:MAG: zinc transporter ZupT [Candidatus Lokiarchaeota archaeon]